jgi:CRP-like cAMP-binding protein
MTDSLSARFTALRAIRELADCSDKAVWSLVSFADELRLPAGASVAQAGRYSTEFVVVMEGTLRAISHGTARRLGPGDSLGWAAMWDRSLNEATVVADSDVRLLVIGHAQFRAFKAVAAPQPLDSRSTLVRQPGWSGLLSCSASARGLPSWPSAKLTVSTSVTPDPITYSASTTRCSGRPDW